MTKPIAYVPLRRAIKNDLAGRRFGRLVARACVGAARGGTVWLCDCDCGVSVEVIGPRLISGNTSSCGCFRREKPTMNAKPPRERFEGFVVRTESCWLWSGVLSNTGYGLLRVSGKFELAHRFAYREFKGPIDDGLFVCHRCDIRRCVNPDHLFLGTQSDNIRDAVEKGRHVSNLPDNRKVSESQAIEIRQRCASGELQRVVAEHFSISQQEVSKIVRRERFAQVKGNM